MDGKKRRNMKAHKARIKRMNTYEVEIGFGINYTSQFTFFLQFLI